MLSNSKPKHTALAFAVVYSLCFLAAFAVIGLPIICFINEVPMTDWPQRYVTTGAVILPMVFGSWVLAYLFGQLAYSKIALPICIFVFGFATPIVLVGFISLSVGMIHGQFLKGVDTQEGQQGLIFLFLFFGILGALMYWRGFRETKRRRIAGS